MEAQTRYEELVNAVQRSTGSRVVLVCHRGGELLGVAGPARGVRGVAHQTSAIVEMAAALGEGLRVGNLNVAALDYADGRLLVVSGGDVILGCLLEAGANVTEALGALRSTLGML